MKATMTLTSEKQWTSNDFLQFPWAVFQLLLNAFSPVNDILLLLMAKVRKTSTRVLFYLGYDSIVIFLQAFYCYVFPVYSSVIVMFLYWCFKLKPIYNRFHGSRFLMFRDVVLQAIMVF